ncbi:hypothetical protein ACWC0C_23800 [Streptomyces sp. NPDC001709]
MITSYSKDKDDLRSSVSALKSRFDRYGINSGDLTQILGICNWLDDQLSTLTRHQVLGAALEREHPGLTMVQVPEPVVSTAQARKDGKDLADRMNKIDGTGDTAQQYHEIAQQLAAHKDDPDYCSSFYAALNPNLAQNLPTFLTSTGSSTAGEDLQAYSQALGTACSDDYPAPGFDKVKKLYLTAPPKGDNVLAWNRGAMLQYGQFPTDFLAKAARVNVLDSFAKDHDQNFSVLSQGKGLGLPDNTMALYLKALGANGDATRDALGHMGGSGCGTDLQGNLKSLITYANQSHDPDMTDALKSALTAGSGDQVTRGADGSLHVVPTMHGGFEADFAATAMSSLAQSHADYKTYKDYIDTTFTAYGTPPGANSDQKGAQDAFLLRLATAGDAKWPPIRPAITAVGKDADALKGDVDFMSGFYSQGGDRFEAQVAMTLHNEDGTHNGQVLNKDSQKILAEFGANLAAASKLEASGKIPTGLTQTFTNPADMWSATMLLKYGPKGREWDPSFLSAMGDAVLHWRATRDMRPVYVDGMKTAAGYASGGFGDPSNAWYSELGLREDSFHMNTDAQFAVFRGITDNDPSLAVLSKLADNAAGSRDLLSGKDGLFAARQLVNDHWQNPGLDDDESAFPAKVITLATLKTPDLSANKQAATAAQNVFQGAMEDYYRSQHASGNENELYPHMPPELAQALANIAGAYTPDLAQSVNNPAPKNPKWNDPRFDVTIDAKTHQPRVVTDVNALDHLIHEILRDPKAGGAYSGYTRAYITTVARTAQSDPDGAQKLLRKLGNLDGHIELARSDAPYSAAERQDAADVEKQKYTWVVGGVLSAVPVPLGAEAPAALETTVGLVQTAIAGETANKSYDFGGGHAAAVASAEQAKSNTEMLSLQFPIIQGLISAHKLPRPEDSRWFHNGQLDADEILKNPTPFNDWKERYGITDNRTYQDLFNAAKDGYGESTPVRGANSDPYKDGN